MKIPWAALLKVKIEHETQDNSRNARSGQVGPAWQSGPIEVSQASENRTYLPEIDKPTPLISVIVPCWRHEDELYRLVKQLPSSRDVEWISALAEPSPAAVARLQGAGVRCISCNYPSRGQQLNAGARVARGQLFVFHHVDSELRAEHLAALRNFVAHSGVNGGAFYRKFDERHPGLRWAECVERWHCRTFGTLYGDQSIFVTRAAFERLGGFANIPLMEDVEFSSRLRRNGPVSLLDPPLRTSPAKHLHEGRWRTTARNFWLQLLYHLGIDPAELHRWYYRSERRS